MKTKSIHADGQEHTDKWSVFHRHVCQIHNQTTPASVIPVSQNAMGLYLKKMVIFMSTCTEKRAKPYRAHIRTQIYISGWSDDGNPQVSALKKIFRPNI